MIKVIDRIAGEIIEGNARAVSKEMFDRLNEYYPHADKRKLDNGNYEIYKLYSCENKMA